MFDGVEVRPHWSGHAWTIGRSLAHQFFGRSAPRSANWSTNLRDPKVGLVPLHGELRHESGSQQCVVVVHGLGGSIAQHYCVEAALAARRLGLSCLRFALRGADRSGADFYHGGLIDDVSAALASPELSAFTRLYVLGFSMGGHVSLRYGTSAIDPRVRAIAAVCAPLDLELGSRHIDRFSSSVYRHHVLAGLKDIYAAVASRHSVPTPLARVLRARSLREWDSLTVVPRFGFGSVEHYYESMSVGPRLHELRVPSLLVESMRDPMVPAWTYERHLQRQLPKLEVQRLDVGGHVAFPRVTWPGSTHPRRAPLVEHILRWFLAH
jgi:predicted alpha/beta-fold hydrolase